MLLIFFILAVAVILVVWRIFGASSRRTRYGPWADGNSIMPMTPTRHEWLDGGAPTSHSWYGENNAASFVANSTGPDFSTNADAGGSWGTGGGSDSGFSNDAGGSSDFGGSGDFGGGGAGGDFS